MGDNVFPLLRPHGTKIPKPPTTGWEAKLTYSALTGLVTKDPPNALIILLHSPQWSGVFSWCEFRDRIVFAKDAPIVEGIPNPKANDLLQDHHYDYVQYALLKQFGPCFARQVIIDMVGSAAKTTPSHVVRDWLNSLVWDGVKRIETWLESYLGAVPSNLTRSFGPWWLISAVARIMRPGCQADHMLVLEGEQDRGKTTTARILGGEWHLGSLRDLGSKDTLQKISRGKWIIELGEFAAIRRTEEAAVKDCLTETHDTFRPAYGRTEVTRPRQVVFIGTTNDPVYLHDATGGRRFWPIRISRLNRDVLIRDRDQLWAEAVTEYKAGAQWWPEIAFPEIVEAQSARFDSDVWEAKIAAWCLDRTQFSVSDVLSECLHIEVGRWGRSEQTRVGMILHRLGYRSVRKTVSGVVKVVYGEETRLK